MWNRVKQYGVIVAAGTALLVIAFVFVVIWAIGQFAEDATTDLADVNPANTAQAVEPRVGSVNINGADRPTPTALPLITPTQVVEEAAVVPQAQPDAIAAAPQVQEAQVTVPDVEALIVTGALQQQAPEIQATQGVWVVQHFAGATEQIRAWVIQTLRPDLWPNFPNVDNGDWKAAQGVEYGMAESVFCQQNETCDFVIPARHYRLYTGDYDIDPVGSCFSGSEGGIGCLFIGVNVGEVTASFEDQVMDTGFTVMGRYWDGDAMPQAMWALASHAVANMLNMNTSINTPQLTNAGTNCSVVNACKGVHVRIAFFSGNEKLSQYETTFLEGAAK